MNVDHDDVKLRELLSALADGELHGEEFVHAVEAAAEGEGRACWQLYHAIGDTLRQCEPLPAGDSALVERLRSQMVLEGAPVRHLHDAALQPLAPPVAASARASRTDPAANDEVLRWKLAAGFASLAAVAVLGWSMYGTAAPQGAQLAQAPAAASAPGQAVAAGEATPPQGSSPVMIRDPRLDELLAAHRQLGNGTSALQMPAGFLRNASFAGRER